MSVVSTGTISRASRDAVGEAAGLYRASAILLAMSSVAAAVNLFLAALLLFALRASPVPYYLGGGGTP